MSYLSLIMVHKGEAAEQRIRDSYAWHRALWAAFPGHDDEPRTFLFRVDDQQQAFRVLMLSELRPTPPRWGHWQVREVSESFLGHSRYRFQVRANPTVKRVVRHDDGSRKKNGRRTGIYDEQELRRWLARKAEAAGAELLDVSSGAPLQTHFVRNGRRGKHVSVDFTGALRVVDRDAFIRTFHQGIGPAKAFGFGLLMLEPVA